MIKFPGENGLKSIGIFAEGDAHREVLRALRFLEKCRISNNPVTVYTDKEQYLQKKEDFSMKA